LALTVPDEALAAPDVVPVAGPVDREDLAVPVVVRVDREDRTVPVVGPADRVAQDKVPVAVQPGLK